ncbi:MAG: molybdate ABC transporter substrate-binding protein [Thermovibrio sp.]|nr:MAG: molybdate ABC transporter substrate-binding protein [Thermovibrio sp.]
MIVRRLLLIIALIPLLVSNSKSGEVTVFAAMGAKELLKKIAGDEIFNFSSSGRLIKQIELGAPCDVYISASKYWIDYGIKKGLIRRETVKPFVRTKLVLIAPKDTKKDNILSGERIAVGNEFAPVGKYAVETLKNLKIYKKLKNRLVFSPTVRQITVWVMTGNVDFGIVYYSDYLLYKDRVRLVKIYPDNLHSPINFYVGCVKGGNLKECLEFEGKLLKMSNSTYESLGFEKVENGF